MIQLLVLDNARITLEKDRPPGSQKDTSKRTEKESEKKVE